MMRRVVSLVVAWAAVAGSPSAMAGGLQECLRGSDPAALEPCLEAALASDLPDDADRDALTRSLVRDPSLVERWADRVLAAADTAGSGLTPSQRADWLDVRGQALAALGRIPEAAEALAEAVALDDGATRLAWVDGAGRHAWTASLDTGAGRLSRAASALASAERGDDARKLAAAALALGAAGPLAGVAAPPTKPLEVAPTFPALPDLSIPLLDGTEVRLSDLRGKVVLLDFWASWCAPCLKELPHLQKLHAAEKERGLEVFAVNMEEGRDAIELTRKALGLAMPIAHYAEGLRSLDVKTLPTLLLIDGRGRLRGRWDGYAAGLETTIAAKVRDLLGRDPEAAPRTIAEILQGAGVLDVVASEPLRAVPSGIGVVLDGEGRRRPIVSAGRELWILDERARIVASKPIPSSLGRLVPAGSGAVLGFRPGSTEVARFDAATGRSRTWTIPSPVFDAAAVVGSAPGARERVALAAGDGVYELRPDAADAVRIAALADARAVAWSGSASSPTVEVLDGAGRRLRVLRDGTATAVEQTPPRAARLVRSPEPAIGVGIGSSWIAAWAVGSFLPGGGTQIAVATVSGQLVILDHASGEVRFRASWPGAFDLAAIDLDGDGRDELVVLAGRQVTILRAAVPAS